MKDQHLFVPKTDKMKQWREYYFVHHHVPPNWSLFDENSDPILGINTPEKLLQELGENYYDDEHVLIGKTKDLLNV